MRGPLLPPSCLHGTLHVTTGILRAGAGPAWASKACSLSVFRALALGLYHAGVDWNPPG